MQALTEIEIEDAPSIFFRKGTSDEHLVATLLESKLEYDLPEIKPKIIMDAGANIGVVAIAMTHLYPEAKIYCYEPNPETFLILHKNTEHYPNIEIHKAALGAEEGHRELFHSDDPKNFGGCSLFENRVDMEKSPFEIVCFDVRKEIETIGQIDILKIDTEGSEFEILNAMTPEQRKGIHTICGELHGIKDYETLALLEPDFHLSFTKHLHAGNWPFHAQRK